ncbi:MAG: oligosaccharide flippase family protein [Shewanella sp.]|nr:oligosaccharide flippase family protein [Shewanella sp.]
MDSVQDPTDEKSSYTSTTTVMMIFISGYFIDFAFNIFLSRHMGSNDYGNFKVAEAFIYLGSIITMMGGASAAPRLLYPHIKNPNKEGVWGYVRFYMFVSTIVSVVLLVLIVIGHYLHISAFNGNSYHPMLLAAIVIPLAGISGLLCGVLHTANRLDLAFIPWGVGYSTLAFLFCFIASLVFGNISSFMAVGIIVAVVISLIVFSSACIHKLSLMPFKKSAEISNRNQWLKVSVPIMVVAGLQMFMRQVDIYMIEFMAGEIAVGHFAAAIVITFVLVVVQLGLIALFSPQIVEALEKGIDGIRELNRKSMVLSLWLVLPLSALLIAFGHQILDLFGHDVELGIVPK